MTAPLANTHAPAVPAFERLWLPSRTNDGAIACETAAGPVSRETFLRRADGLAARLADGKEPCLLIAGDSFHFALGFAAAMRAGRDLLLPPNLQTETLRDPVFAGAMRLDDALIAAAPPAVLPPAPLDPAQGITLFTSGSTGEPKRVEKRLRQLSAEADVLEQHFGARLANTAVAATVPHIHIYGILFRIVWPLAAGRPFLAAPVTGANLAPVRGNALIASPAFLTRIEPERLAAAAPALIFSSGGKLPDAVAETLADVTGRSLIEVYGSTETGGIAWRDRNDRTPGKRDEWTPFREVELRFEADESRLHVRSAATGGNWLDSGDIARPGKAGRFVLEGRVDGVLKIEDKRVSLAVISERLESHPWIREARLVELPLPRRQLGAVVRLNADGDSALAREGRRAVSDALKTHLRQYVDAVVVPRKWRFVMEFPLNAMGKTTAAGLRALFAPERGA